MNANTIKKTVSKYKELEDKVFKIIAETYDSNIEYVTGINVDGDNLDVNWDWHCRGYIDCDSKMIPIKWLEDGFDYKAAHAEDTAKSRKRKMKQHRSIVAYRAKSSDSGSWITHMYGKADKPLEKTSMNDLAYSIAYLYHRHPVELYTSYDGKNFSKASGALAKTFSKIMDDKFLLDEHRG